MSRLKIKREEKEEAQEAEIVTRWSIPKIVIAVGLLALVVMLGVYAFEGSSASSEGVLGATEKGEDSPKIQLPTKEKVEQIVEEAKESIANIDAENIVDSQPQIKKAIEDLEKLTTSDTNAKKAVCDAVCK